MSERRIKERVIESEGYMSPNETLIERKMEDLEFQCAMIIGFKSYILDNIEVMN